MVRSSTSLTLALWLLFNAFTTSLAAEINSACNTPTRQPGICTPLPQCEELNAILQKPRPLPATDVNLLRASQCGYLNRQPLVCCRTRNTPPTPAPPTPAPTTPAPTTTTARSAAIFEVVPPPKDVSHHRNLGLINTEFCGQTATERIIGGNKTGILEFPWMALLKYRTPKGNKFEESFRCGGSLISPKYILTAAHCISNTTRLRLVSARLGDHNYATEQDCEEISSKWVCAPPYQNIDVESFARHPGYNPKTYVNDIALVRLARPADITKDNVKTICLPVGLEEQAKNLDGKKMFVAGWGFTETGAVSTELLKVILPVMSVQQCHNVFHGQFGFSINGNQLCAGGTNLTQDSCRGDSGGPLKMWGVVNMDSSMIQYGVVSYGHRHCGTAGVPGVYTRVGHYMDWILNTMRP